MRLSEGYRVVIVSHVGYCDNGLIFMKVVLLCGRTAMRKLLRRFSWSLLLELTLVINWD